MSSNYPDNIRDFDQHPGSPYYIEPPPQCPHCNEYCKENQDECPECGMHTYDIKCTDCMKEFIPQTEEEFNKEVCEGCLYERDEI